MVRILDTYQQTFVCSTASTSQLFNFNRVYKQDPSNKIRLSVSQISSFTADSSSDLQPHAIYLSGIPELTGKCSVLDKAGTNELRDNRCLLGVLGGDVTTTTNKGSSHITHQPQFIMNDLPLGIFKIQLEHLVRETFDEDCVFLVSFQIDVCEY
tara:strand:+ start:3472 stop:3933 length:462 start_codon:yes stop_codon:yes gene_type:complete